MRSDEGERVLDEMLHAAAAEDPASHPPAGLEDRVAAAVRETWQERRQGGYSRLIRARWIRYAAVLVLMAGAFLGGRLSRVNGSPLGDRYLLLLYEGPGFDPPAPGRMQDRVAEYIAWARDLREAGTEVSGEELALDGLRLQPPDGSGVVAVPDPSRAQVMTGYFMIRAEDLDQALTVARSLPHLRHGGSIEVRRVVETGP